MYQRKTRASEGAGNDSGKFIQLGSIILIFFRHLLHAKEKKINFLSFLQYFQFYILSTEKAHKKGEENVYI